MAEQLKKLFSKEIQENLFPSNEFYTQSVRDSSPSPDVAIVQIPQAGAIPTIISSPSSFPLTAAQRTDDVIEYTLTHLATTPTHIVNANEAVLSYSKRESVLYNHKEALNTACASLLGVSWAKTGTGNIITTSGGTRASSFGGAAKKAVVYADILNLKKQFDRDNIPAEGRFMLVSPEMHEDMLRIEEFISFDFNSRKPIVEGAIGYILGFGVYMRSRSVVYDNTNAKIAYTATPAATDRDSILAWHKNYVRRAISNVRTYVDLDSALYLGTVMNAEVRAGGVKGRTDAKGCYSLVQAEFA
jgi:hypothetical protein